MFPLCWISNSIFCRVVSPAEERSFLLHALLSGKERERGKKSIVCGREMQRGCWYALIVFEFSVRSLSNGYPLLCGREMQRGCWRPPIVFLSSQCNLFPIWLHGYLLLEFVISCLASCRGASLLTEVHFFLWLRPITPSHIVAHATQQKTTDESLPSFMSRWVSYSSTQMLALRSLSDTVCGPDDVTFVCSMQGSHLFKQSSIIYPWNCDMFSIIWLHGRSPHRFVHAPTLKK